MTSSIQPSGFTPIVERMLQLVNEQTGESRPIAVQIGQPYWIEEGFEAACPVAITELLDRRDIRGMDFFNALESALTFVQTILTDREAPEKVCWPDGEAYGED